MKNCLIVANWKLNKNTILIKEFFQILKKENTIITNAKSQIAIAPPTIYLHLTKKYIKNYPNISIVAQNVDIHLSGAFTGETSAAMLKDIGVKYVIIGHSERRKYHQENNQLISKKFNIVKQTHLIPILCIGENEEEKNNGQTEFICKQQLDTIFQLLGAKAFENTIIAYEPTWSIGKGITDTPENIQKIHNFIRNHIASYNTTIAKKITIQYGGSVNAHNVSNLLIQPDINGVLVGANSLQATSFLSIIKHAEKIQYKT